jgi:uncharacterized protein (DUF362 family)
MRTTVAVTCGAGRYANIAEALRLIQNQVDLRGRQAVLIKPNCVSVTARLASTHREALHAVLAFVRRAYDGPLTIAEGAATVNTWDAFERLDYCSLAKTYDARLVDLNADAVVPVPVYDRRLQRKTLHLARTVVDSDFRISVCSPKTHDTVLVTLSLKNMIMGALPNRLLAQRSQGRVTPRFGSGRLASVVQRARQLARTPWRLQMIRMRLRIGSASDKVSMHQGIPVINLNLALLASWVRPHLAVVDGFAGMDGEGPVLGDAVDWRIALAGTDALAVDCLTTHLMGLDPAEVGYLNYCARLGYGVHQIDAMDVVGHADLQSLRRTFRLHSGHVAQRRWHLAAAERYLAAGCRKIDWEIAQ